MPDDNSQVLLPAHIMAACGNAVMAAHSTAGLSNKILDNNKSDKVKIYPTAIASMELKFDLKGKAYSGFWRESKHAVESNWNIIHTAN